MGYLFDQLHFPDESRMTGVWTHSVLDEPVGEEIAFGQLLALREDQDPVVEADFLCSHAPYTVGGLYGVYPDGSGWVFLIQKAPADAYELVGARDPWWPMLDGLARALDQCPGASTRAHVAWTREGLLQTYAERGAPWNTVANWPLSALLWGLLAESCYVTLRDIAEAYPDGCVVGDEEHDCDRDVFTEVFTRWSAGLIATPESVEPDDDTDDDETAAPWPPTRKILPAVARRMPRDADLLRRFLKTGARRSTAGDPGITYAHENPAAWRALKVELSEKKYKALRRAVKMAHGMVPTVRPLGRKRIAPSADGSLAPLDPEDALRALLAVKPDYRPYASRMGTNVYLHGGHRDGQFHDEYIDKIEGVRLHYQGGSGGPDALYEATDETIERDGVVFEIWKLVVES